MSSHASFIFLFLFIFLTSIRASAQKITYLDSSCSDTPTYTRNSTYFTNLKALLSSLSSLNASYSTGFQNATSGQAPNIVTGLFLCRGDVSPEVCRTCVTSAVNNTLTQCPNQREVMLYYDQCLLRYSHENILSKLVYGKRFHKMNYNDISSNVVMFVDLVSSTLNQAIVEAANNSRKFYAMNASWTGLQNLYVLVQCTPDITREDCLTCLQYSINGLPRARIGARLFWGSCNSRYELYQFYNQTAVNTLPPQRLPPVTSYPPRNVKCGHSKVLVVAIPVAIISVLLTLLAVYCFLAKRKKKTSDIEPTFDEDDMTTIESLQLDYRTIQDSTNNFSENNKIGQGGFGEVYKGIFSDGKEVAVKRLSKSSRQGDTEFKNEVIVVAKLQHRNLVRFLGFCLDQDERILVYEYVPNKSLDYFLSDPAMQGQLNWTQRYIIIGGIARGILYLHQDSRLTIIHRDLKASNILLDVDMNPRISDFGMARTFGMDQTQENTSKIVGTYGYMSPEYAMHGQFSMKSDIYSFGVLVLEIISGRKNNSFYEINGAQDLVTHAWNLWVSGRALDLVDPVIVDHCQKTDVVRCIHIGLLCVQEDSVERPVMGSILIMLTSNTVTLPMPRQPGYYVQTRPKNDLLDSDPTLVYDSSITDVHPR